MGMISNQREHVVDVTVVDELDNQVIRLTPTQLKVMKGVHSGLPNKQIAFDLGIAEATVKAHMTALMRKLKVRNRTQVAIAAQTIGWAQPGEASPFASAGRAS